MLVIFQIPPWFERLFFEVSSSSLSLPSTIWELHNDDLFVLAFTARKFSSDLASSISLNKFGLLFESFVKLLRLKASRSWVRFWFAEATLTLDPSRAGVTEGCSWSGPVVVRPNFRPMTRKRGRKVARLPAVMASPCSVVDQIAMSVVASKTGKLVERTLLDGLEDKHRKSGFLKSLIKPNRTKTAALALHSS